MNAPVLSAEWREREARQDEQEAQQLRERQEQREQDELERRRTLELMGVRARTPFEVAVEAHRVRDREVERQTREWEQTRSQRESAAYRAQASQISSLRARLS